MSDPSRSRSSGFAKSCRRCSTTPIRSPNGSAAKRDRRRGHRAGRGDAGAEGARTTLGRSPETVVSRHRPQRRDDLDGAQPAKGPVLCRRHGRSRRDRSAPGAKARPIPSRRSSRSRTASACAQAIAGLPSPFLETLVMRDINGLSYRDIAEATERADRHGDVAARARPRLARQDPEGGAMTDPRPDDRILRLNAALDGELDAMGSLELEREMRGEPGARGRISPPRGASRVDGPPPCAARGGAEALADRIAALARRPRSASDSAAAPSFPSRAGPASGWSGARVFALAASFAAVGFAVGAGLTTLRMPSAVARRRPAPRLRFRPRRDRRPAVRRRLLGPAHGQALARRPHHRQRRRSSISLRRVSRSPADASPSSTGFRRRRSSIATTNISSRSPNCRSAFAGARARGGGDRDDRRLSRRPLVRRESCLRRRLRHGREEARRIRRGVPPGAAASFRSARQVSQFHGPLAVSRHIRSAVV